MARPFRVLILQSCLVNQATLYWGNVRIAASKYARPMSFPACISAMTVPCSIPFWMIWPSIWNLSLLPSVKLDSHWSEKEESVTDRLSEIEARANAATVGPWVADKLRDHGESFEAIKRAIDIRGLRINLPVALVMTWQDKTPSAEMNAEAVRTADFIAHARADIPWLVAEVRRLTEDAADLKYELNEADR